MSLAIILDHFCIIFPHYLQAGKRCSFVFHLFTRYIANFISYFKLLAIALIVTGQNPFQMLGTNTPRVWSWGQENKVWNASFRAWAQQVWNHLHGGFPACPDTCVENQGCSRVHISGVVLRNFVWKKKKNVVRVSSTNMSRCVMCLCLTTASFSYRYFPVSWCSSSVTCWRPSSCPQEPLR